MLLAVLHLNECRAAKRPYTRASRFAFCIILGFCPALNKERSTKPFTGVITFRSVPDTLGKYERRMRCEMVVSPCSPPPFFLIFEALCQENRRINEENGFSKRT
jgi:hypothetical protein